MKNVQIIDGAMNCTYSIFSFTEEEFRVVFPAEGQDIEFIEDAIERVGDERLGAIMRPIWSRMLNKKEVQGIHGTLFYELDFKKRYYPTKIDAEMISAL